MIVLPVWVIRKNVRYARLEFLHPDEPWLWHQQWHGPRITPRLAAERLLWIAAIVVALCGIPYIALVVPVVIAQVGSGEIYFLSALAVLLSITLPTAALWRTLRRRPVRRAYLQLDSMPIILGRALRGLLVLAPGRPGMKSVSVRLDLMSIYSRGRRAHMSRWPMTEVTFHRASFDEGGAPSFAICLDTEDSWPSYGEGDTKSTLRRLEITTGSHWRRSRLTFEAPLFAMTRASTGTSETRRQ